MIRCIYLACAACLICLTVEPCLPIIAPTESLGTRILKKNSFDIYSMLLSPTEVDNHLIVRMYNPLVFFFRVKTKIFRKKKNRITLEENQ